MAQGDTQLVSVCGAVATCIWLLIRSTGVKYTYGNSGRSFVIVGSALFVISNLTKSFKKSAMHSKN